MKQVVRPTWYSDGPLLTQEGVTGQGWDADTCHISCSHLELVLPVLLQVRHLQTKTQDVKIFLKPFKLILFLVYC